MWKLVLRPRKSFLGNIFFEFRFWVLCSVRFRSNQSWSSLQHCCISCGGPSHIATGPEPLSICCSAVETRACIPKIGQGQSISQVSCMVFKGLKQRVSKSSIGYLIRHIWTSQFRGWQVYAHSILRKSSADCSQTHSDNFGDFLLSHCPPPTGCCPPPLHPQGAVPPLALLPSFADAKARRNNLSK
jgi:hypothetical protein